MHSHCSACRRSLRVSALAPGAATLATPTLLPVGATDLTPVVTAPALV